MPFAYQRNEAGHWETANGSNQLSSNLVWNQPFGPGGVNAFTLSQKHQSKRPDPFELILVP